MTTRRAKLLAIVERHEAEGRPVSETIRAFTAGGGSGLESFVVSTYASLDSLFAPEDECAPQNEALVAAQAALEQANQAIASALAK